MTTFRDHADDCDCQCVRCHDAGTCARCDPDYPLSDPEGIWEGWWRV